MKALYGSLVKNLLMRARILFLSMEDAFRECENNLEKFVKLTPLTGKQKSFCTDAFEIGLIQEKVVFLVSKIRELVLNWVSLKMQPSKKL